MNILLSIGAIVFAFTAEVFVEKRFGKEGLYAWIAVATVLANIFVCKTVNIAGMSVTLGNVMFASVFLATDIMNEKYGASESRKAVTLGLIACVGFVVSSLYVLAFIPDDVDIVNDSMKTLFSFSARTSIASVAMYYVANLTDIWLFEKLKKRFPDKLWLRNNVATIVTNCGEDFMFALLAFSGIYDIKTLLVIAGTTSVVECIIAICDTPFLYLSKRIGNGKRKEPCIN